ncbi:hypothetical protein [Actinomyces glycerinitolerans]|uniref:Prokaryotic membrane lipoprotein lipid attachment site profile n=1 Tax=Actinomyces glycerinitolerans TaxID=1892869 RepID=A0A1M4S3Q2_9ACTO|nr:hypothetical protein [Actinomyces glycerinitolerans]SHE26835.1 Hypothetical protein ACGLYG10_3090 [Actinomyces glycerinitolerans]
MSRLSRLTTLVATSVTAVALTASMSACSSNSDDAADQGSDQQVTTTADTDTGSDDADETEAAAEPTVPDGYTLTEVPGAELSVPVPDGWEAITGDDLADSERVEAVASALGYTTDQITAMMASIGLYAADTSGTSTLAENYNIQVVATSVMPGEADFNDMLTGSEQLPGVSSLTPGTFSEPKTASGEDAAMHTFTMNMDYATEPIEGAYLAIPTQDGQTALITMGTASAERTQELADVILGSI